MPFPSALSGANQTTKRKGGSFERFLIVHTPSVQLQFNPSEAASANVSGFIPFSSTLSGAYTNVLLGMTVIISPSSDYASDLKNQPENCFVSYIRKAATATTLYIGQTKYQFTTSNYVTVLNDYRVFERKVRRVSGIDIRRDYDINFRKPKPRISGVYATISSTSGASASIAFTPSAEVMASSGSISTWAWDVDDGTITTGTSSSQNITVSFPLGTRYVHLTVTDSNGVSNYITALIVVVPNSLASVIHLDNGNFSITKDLDSGNSASFVAYANATWLDGSQAMIATKARYADGTSALTVSMTGWLKDPSDSIVGSDENGVIRQLSASIQDIGFYLSQINCEGFYTDRKTTPSQWGEFARVTPFDAIWYNASEHSTAPNVASFDFPSGYTSYQIPTLNIPSGTLLSVIQDLAFRSLGATVNYSPNGELVFRASLLYETSDSNRDAATVYATYTSEDGTNLDYARVTNQEIKPLGQILMGCAMFNTTTKLPRVYYSKAPAGDESGYLIEELDSIILAANGSDATARSTAGAFTANHFFASNENPIATFDLLDGYHTIEPSAFQWHKFSIAASETISGIAITTDERFLCLALNIAYDDELGRVAVSGTFRRETNGADNYLQETEYVPTNVPNPEPFVPQYEPYPYLDTGTTKGNTYGNQGGSGGSGTQNPTLPPQQAGETQGSDPHVQETIYVPFFSNDAVETGTALAFGVNYLIRVTGDAKLTEAHWVNDFNFTIDQQGFSILSGTYVPGIGFQSVPTGGPAWDGLNDITITVASTRMTDIRYTGNANGTGVLSARGIYRNGVPNTLTNPQFTFTIIDTRDSNVSTIRLVNSTDGSGSGSDVDTQILRATAEGTGTNPFSTGEATNVEEFRGDAYYWKYNADGGVEAYPAGTGLYINGSLPTTPSYDAGHVYEFSVVGTGAPWPFQYYDPEGVYTDNDNAYMKVEIIAL